MALELEEKGYAGGKQDYTQDGTVDLKGRPILRSNTGRWRACSFIVGYEAFERMAYFGIASNLVLYLTTKLHEGTVTSSTNVTNWVGTVWILPILGAYVADAHLGRYWTFIIASAIYLMGMSLLTLAVSVPALRPPSCRHGETECDKKASALQIGIFYAALFIIAAGTGGTKPNISTMGADQFDDFEPKERNQKLSFFNWWMFAIFIGTLFSNTFVVYIQDNVGYPLGYGILTLGLAVAMIVFLVGTPFYRHKLPAGSPFTRMGQVLVAAIRKWKVPLPDDPKQLHELSMEEYSKSGKFRIDYTPSLRFDSSISRFAKFNSLRDKVLNPLCNGRYLKPCSMILTLLFALMSSILIGLDRFCRFLDKAAVKTDSGSPWMLCPVTQVEQTKQMIKMIPVWVTTFIPSTIIGQVNTLFIKQGTTLDRSMGPHFKIPPACLTAFVTISMLITIVIYDRYFVPIIRRYTKNPRGITLLQRMGIGFLLQVIIMITACLAERKRLSVAKQHNITGKNGIVPLSIFILLPQFVLMGIADNFVEVAKIEFFYDQAPEGMKSLGTSYFTSSSGIGNFLSSFLLKTVSNITKKHGHKGWILDNLNTSHLDYYYACLAILSFLNFLVYLVATRYFVYNVDVDSKKKFLDGMETSLVKAHVDDEKLKVGY